MIKSDPGPGPGPGASGLWQYTLRESEGLSKIGCNIAYLAGTGWARGCFASMAKRGKKKGATRARTARMPDEQLPHPKTGDSFFARKSIELKRIFQVLNTITMGCCHSGVKGVSGSLRQGSLLKVLNALSTNGGHLVDFGCGFGRVLLSALAHGFHGATGWEFVENETQRVAFELTKAKFPAYSDASWIGQDILTLDPTLELCGQVTSAYAFWVGFPKPVQLRILDLCGSSFNNICSVAVFLDSKWRKPKQGMVILWHTCDIYDLLFRCFRTSVPDTICLLNKLCGQVSSRLTVLCTTTGSSRHPQPAVPCEFMPTNLGTFSDDNNLQCGKRRAAHCVGLSEIKRITAQSHYAPAPRAAPH